MNNLEEKLKLLRIKWKNEKDPEMRKVIEAQGKLLKKQILENNKKYEEAVQVFTN